MNINWFLPTKGVGMTYLRDGLPLPLGHTGPLRIEGRPAWTLVFAARKPFGIEMIWRKDEPSG